MLVNILIGVVVVIVALLAFAAARPAEFRVKRTTIIKAPPERVFGLINDFHNWGSWSPWEQIDPGMQRIFTGPTNGVGSAYAWSGNAKAGEGRMQILKSDRPSKLALSLNFTRPFKSSYTTEFSTNGNGNGNETQVAWEMYGPNSYMAKVAGIFMNTQEMVGRDFERGLASMKAVAEK